MFGRKIPPKSVKKSQVGNRLGNAPTGKKSKKQLNKGEMKRIRELREGTKEKSFTSEILYQKLYMYYKKIPLIKGYLLRIRRKLEIINIEDEYKTRLQASKVITRALLIIIPTAPPAISLKRLQS